LVGLLLGILTIIVASSPAVAGEVEDDIVIASIPVHGSGAWRVISDVLIFRFAACTEDEWWANDERCPAETALEFELAPTAAGDTFFYTNPLESAGDVSRSEYFDVACCPANLARLIAQVPGLIYGVRDAEIFVNLYVGSRTVLEIPGAGEVTLVQETGYPWDGTVRMRLTLASPAEIGVYLRMPGWAGDSPVPSDLYRFAGTSETSPSIRINGESVTVSPVRGFVELSRTWTSGDEIELDLPMPVRRVLAHPKVTEAEGKVALQRGPIVFAVEAIDHDGKVLDLELPGDSVISAEHSTDLLGGVTVVKTTAVRGDQEVPLVAIPYFAWANRDPGEMVVWLQGAEDR